MQQKTATLCGNRCGGNFRPSMSQDFCFHHGTVLTAPPLHEAPGQTMPLQNHERLKSITMMHHIYHQSQSPGPHPQDLFPLTLTEGWEELMTFIEMKLMLEARPTGQPPNSKHCVYYTTCSPLSETFYLPFTLPLCVVTLIYFIYE